MVGVFRIIIGELKMNYVSWIDSDGQAHDISEMPTEYIKNCIKCIQNSDYENKTKKDAQKDKEHKIFEAWWCYKYAQNYIDAFNFELSIRKRGKRKDYPTFTIEKSCNSCKKQVTCNSNIVCNKWDINSLTIFDKLSGEDLEVAKRYGFYYNAIENSEEEN